jgi:hypothetical protein
MTTSLSRNFRYPESIHSLHLPLLRAPPLTTQPRLASPSTLPFLSHRSTSTLLPAPHQFPFPWPPDLRATSTALTVLLNISLWPTQRDAGLSLPLLIVAAYSAILDLTSMSSADRSISRNCIALASNLLISMAPMPRGPQHASCRSWRLSP